LEQEFQFDDALIGGATVVDHVEGTGVASGVVHVDYGGVDVCSGTSRNGVGREEVGDSVG
jgi:hypothetical protein